MKIWLIFIQTDDTTWLEAAWDDNSTAENYKGWEEEVARCTKLATDNKYEMRIVSTTLDGVYDAFEVPDLSSTKVEPA